MWPWSEISQISELLSVQARSSPCPPPWRRLFAATSRTAHTIAVADSRSRPASWAATAANADWQMALKEHTGGPAQNNGMTDVTAVAGNDAWAVGGTYPSGYTAGTPVAENWNGTKWQATTLPSGLTGTLGAVSAPASSA